jgi:hypothetical protein
MCAFSATFQSFSSLLSEQQKAYHRKSTVGLRENYNYVDNVSEMTDSDCRLAHVRGVKQHSGSEVSYLSHFNQFVCNVM